MPISVAFWARSDVTLDSTTTGGWIGGANRANTDGLGWTSSVTGGGWRFQVKSGATTYTVDATNAKVEAGRWYFVAGTYDGSTLKVYVDGSRVNSNTIGSKTIDNTTSALTIGLVGSGYWDGAVDEVGLWADDLSSTQIADLQAAARRTSADVALTTRTDYDALGRAVSSTSPRGIQTRHEYDRLGRMVATIANARDGAPASATSDDDMKSTFAYNAVGELIGHCSAKQVHVGGCDPTSSGEDQAWRYAYDAMGRRISQTPPVNTTATALAVREWSYQAGGRLNSVIDRTVAGGGTIHRHTDYSHDALGRVISETVYLGSGTSNPELSWTTAWNSDGTRDGRDFDGSAASPAQGTDSWDFTYDPLGRPDLVKQGSTTVTDYAWNPSGTLASRLDLGIGTTAFSHDWAGRQNGVTAPSMFGSGSIGVAYGLDGVLTSRTTPNGVAAGLTYDAAKRPTEVDFAGDTLSRGYDRDGNVTSEGRSFSGVSGDAGSGTATFTLDGVNRVTGMDGLSRDDAFTYDRNGNRITKVEGAATTTYSYDRSDQLIKQTIGSTDTLFAYNAYGDMTSSADAFNTATAHGYDAGSRLISLTPPGASASSYTYDTLGRVTTRTTGSATLTYRYVGTSHLSYAVIPGTGAATYSLLDASAGRVALDTGGTTAWTMFDLHGNLAGAQAETTDTVVSALRYDAYGQQLDDYTAGSGSTDMPWRFQDRLDLSPDADEALYDFGARMYRPSGGTFTQLDTYAGQAQNPLSMNRFLYAHANPVTLIDPSGHCVTCGPMIDGLIGHHTTRGPQSLAWAAPVSSNFQLPAERKLFGRIYTSNPNRGFDLGDLGGLAVGAVEGVGAIAQSAVDIGAWSWRTATDEKQRELNGIVWDYLSQNPGEALAAMWSGLVDPIVQDWRAGNEGEAIGRAAFEIGSAVAPIVKAASALRAARGLGKGASAADEALDAVTTPYASLLASKSPLAAARLVSNITSDIVGQGRSALRTSLTDEMNDAVLSRPYLENMYLGTVVHNQVAAELNRIAPNRFEYSPSYGPDIYDRLTHSYIEIHTVTGTRGHWNSYQSLWHPYGQRDAAHTVPVNFVSYELP